MPPVLAGACSKGKYFVVPKGWVSPPICLFTGAASPLTPLRQARLLQMHPAWVLLILLTPVILIIVSFFVTKRGTIYYVLSEACERQQRRRFWINGALFAGAVTLCFSSADSGFALLLPAGIIFLLVSAVLAATWCRPLKASKIDKISIWLVGIPLDVQDRIMRWEARKFARSGSPLPLS